MHPMHFQPVASTLALRCSASHKLAVRSKPGYVSGLFSVPGCPVAVNEPAHNATCAAVACGHDAGRLLPLCLQCCADCLPLCPRLCLAALLPLLRSLSGRLYLEAPWRHHLWTPATPASSLQQLHWPSWTASIRWCSCPAWQTSWVPVGIELSSPWQRTLCLRCGHTRPGPGTCRPRPLGPSLVGSSWRLSLCTCTSCGYIEWSCLPMQLPRLTHSRPAARY
jgi:hypothetical protein